MSRFRPVRPRRVPAMLAVLAVMTGVLGLGSGAMAAGRSYHVEAVPNPPGAKNAGLFGISCPMVAGCVAVGYATTKPAGNLVETYAGGKWTPTAFQQGLTFPTVGAVWCASMTSCVAVGDAGALESNGATTTGRDPLGRDLDADEPSAAGHGHHGFFGRHQLRHGGVVRGRRIHGGQPGQQLRPPRSALERHVDRPKSVPPLPRRPNQASGRCNASRPPRVTRWASTAASRRRTASSRPCRGMGGRGRPSGHRHLGFPVVRLVEFVPGRRDHGGQRRLHRDVERNDVDGR